MNEDLRKRIEEFNKIKYPKDNETRIIITTLKPQGTVTTAPKYNKQQANVTREKTKIPKR